MFPVDIIKIISNYTYIIVDPLPQFLVDHNKISWWALCQNPSIPLQFFEDKKSKIDWKVLCQKPYITIQF